MKRHLDLFRCILLEKFHLHSDQNSPIVIVSVFVQHRHIGVEILAIPLIVCEKSFSIFSQNKDKNQEIS